ncbi:MAG: hypothetical protein WBG50_22480 [Desulfomonilaceae bacterium]
MTKEELEGAVIAYMDSFTTMTLACSTEDKPWTAAVYYARQGLDLIFFSSPTSRHSEIFSRNPLAAAAIHGDYRGWKEIKGLQMEGRIHSVTGPKAKARAISTYVKRHPFVREFLSDPLSISSKIASKMTKVKLYFFRPDAILYLNNEAGFGTRWKLEVEGGRASGLAGEPLL